MTNFQKLFIYVEGIEDQMFIENILRELFFKSQIQFFVIPYQQKPNDLINKHIQKISSRKYKYVFLSDLDYKFYPCFTSRKNKRIKEYPNLNTQNIVIVREEIESWYLAGINNSNNSFRNLEIPNNTENITKEDFNDIIENSNFTSKGDFLMEISRTYDLNLALKRNRSLKYFLNKLNLLENN